MNWNERDTVKKGNIGERIVNEYLTKKGLIIYEPTSNNAHCFDKIVSNNKEKLIVVEVKTKPKRDFFPDTGFDYKHYLEYKHISEFHNLDVYVFFVDETMGKIYGGRLADIEKPNCYEHNGKILSYPKVEQCGNKKIIYFYQKNMKVIANLTEEQVKEIKNYTTRNEKYNY